MCVLLGNYTDLTDSTLMTFLDDIDEWLGFSGSLVDITFLRYY